MVMFYTFIYHLNTFIYHSNTFIYHLYTFTYHLYTFIHHLYIIYTQIIHEFRHFQKCKKMSKRNLASPELPGYFKNSCKREKLRRTRSRSQIQLQKAKTTQTHENTFSDFSIFWDFSTFYMLWATHFNLVL